MSVIQNICPNCFGKYSFIDGECSKCGYREEEKRSTQALPAGYLLNNEYCLGRVLGIGGFGITYLACNINVTDENAIYAVKEYFPQEWASRNGEDLVEPKSKTLIQVYSHGLDVFFNEAKFLKALQDDKTIVHIEKFFTKNNTGYLVMEYIQGETLAGYMKARQKPFSVDHAEKIIITVARALQKVHSFELLHRDISPDNIMLLRDGRVKLIDFGATRQFAWDRTMDMSVVVKVGFAPMEQYSKTGKQGPWTDVYALAATFYYMVSGKKPLSAVERSVTKEMTPLCEVNTKVSKKLSNLIDRALEMDYTKRIQNMQQFIEELQKLHVHQTNKERIPYVILQTKQEMKKWRFRSNQTVWIGRTQECQIYLEKSEISRVHCGIQYDGQKNFFVVSDYSKNGTFTQKGLIGRGRTEILHASDFFYLVTEKNLFYLEVR